MATQNVGEGHQMNKSVSVQAVAGAIRATDGVTKSARYTHKGSRSIRSCGVYVTKNFNNEIVIDYWTGGYKHQAERASSDLSKVIDTLTAKGYAVVANEVRGYYGNSFRTELVVKVAA